MADLVAPQRFIFVEANGLRHRLAVSGPQDGPLVLFVHGFPESWYSWRHQLSFLGQLGYYCAAPDIRGYGETDKPDEVQAYDMQSLTSDMAALARALSPDQPAILIGHDWGAPIAWNSANLHPDQFRAVAGLSVPYLPPGDKAAIDIFKAYFTARGLFFYQVYFQEEGIAEAELEADPASTIRKFYYAISGDAPDGTWPKDKRHGDTLLYRLPDPPAPLAWLSEADIAYYAGQFARSGFRGPLNRYRNAHRDFDFLKQRADTRIHQPSLFIGGSRDLVLSSFPGDPVAMMKPFLTDLRDTIILDGCGHWTQQERAEAVNQHLRNWLERL